MWHELTQDNLANAIERAYEESPKVRQVAPGLISVPCSSGMHPAGHLTEFERRADGTLYGRCWVGENQGCPAELSRRPCWHLAAGVTLFLARESMAFAAGPDDAVERAVQFDGAMPPPAKGRDRFVGPIVPGEAFRFVCKRNHKGPEREPDPDAVLVVPPIVKKGKVERVRGIQI